MADRCQIFRLVASIRHDQYLISYIMNDIIAASSGGANADTVTNCVSDLSDYFTSHIHNEERLIYVLGYPKWCEHDKDHENLIDSIGSLVERHLSISLRECMALKRMFSEHAQKFDKALLSHALTGNQSIDGRKELHRCGEAYA